MARRRDFRMTQGRSRAPNRSWAGFSNSGVISLPANNKVIVASFTLSNPGIDETILRTVGSLHVKSDQVVATETVIGALGMIIVTDQAFSVGITAMPDPITDQEDDGWFLYVPFSNSFTFVTGAGFTSFGSEYTFDSKAKRIFERGSTVAVIMANASASNGLQFAMVARLLSMVRGTR